MVTIVDPPSGWQYGFPQPLEDDYEAQLRRAGYEGEDLEFALKHSRYWERHDDEEKLDEDKEHGKDQEWGEA